MIKTIVKRTYVNDEGFEFTAEPIENSLKLIKTKTGFEARYLSQDNDPIDPREDTNYSVMTCFHSRYSLGDKHNFSDYSSWVYDLARELGADKCPKCNFIGALAWQDPDNPEIKI